MNRFSLVVVIDPLLFPSRRADVGKPKAVTAAEFINRRVQGVNVTP